MPEWGSVNGTKTAPPIEEVKLCSDEATILAVSEVESDRKWDSRGGRVDSINSGDEAAGDAGDHILTKDHRLVSGMITTLEMTPRMNGRVRKMLFEQIRTNFMIHAQAEEEVLYPAMRNLMFMRGRIEGGRLIS